MYRFQIHQFLMESSLYLPCGGPSSPTNTAKGDECPTIQTSVAALDEFPQVHWMGRRFGTSLRSYDVGDGVLTCAADDLKIHVDRTGSHITLDFDISDDKAVGRARACTVNYSVAICTLLRGGLPLHGASAEADGRRVGILAPSGSGKSTLLWALLDRGALFSSDDLIATWVKQGRVIAATSAGLHAKLSRSALDERRMDPAQYEPLGPHVEEFWIPLAAERRADEPRPLDVLFVLRPGSDPGQRDSITVRRMLMGAAVSMLMENTYGIWAIAGMVDARGLRSLYHAVLRTVPIYAVV